MHNQKTSHGRLWNFALLAIAAAGPLNALAADAEEIALLRKEMAALQQRLDTLEARSNYVADIQEQNQPAVAANAHGLIIESADKNYAIQVRPRIQMDGRWFSGDGAGDSGFTLRRVRPVVQGRAGPLDWRFSPELAGTVRILDAWGDLHLSSDNLLRIGKIKTVIGYERLQSFSQTLFLERGLPSVLTPTRDMGIEWHGYAAGNTIQWTIGTYNGVLDDTDLSSNTNLDGKDLDFGGRLAISPWKGHADTALAGLTFGIAALLGTEHTLIDDSDRDRRIRYRTSGRAIFFRYNDGVRVNGDRVRANAFLSWYVGPFGFLTEYLKSSYDLERGGTRKEVDTDACTIQASWVLTGELASYKAIRPRKPFNPREGDWGAFEVGLRYHLLKVGSEAFEGNNSTRLARSNATQKASAYGFALNWYLTDNLLGGIDFETTEFSGHGIHRPNEDVLLSRFQIDF